MENSFSCPGCYRPFGSWLKMVQHRHDNEGCLEAGKVVTQSILEKRDG